MPNARSSPWVPRANRWESDNIAFIETRWKATYEQCRRYYSQVDYAAALSVPTPTSLRTYLREIGNRYPDPLFVTKTVEVVQALGVFRELSEEIQRSIQPRKLDFAIVWGSMKVLVEVRSYILREDGLWALADGSVIAHSPSSL